MPDFTALPRNTPLTEVPCPRREPTRCTLPEGGSPPKGPRPYERGRRQGRQHLPCAPGHRARERAPLWLSASRPAGWHHPQCIEMRWAPRFGGGSPVQGGRRGYGRTGPRGRFPIGTGPTPCGAFETVRGDYEPIAASERGVGVAGHRHESAGIQHWRGYDEGRAGVENS